MSKRYKITTDDAIAVLRRMQEPDPFEPQITQIAFDALEMAIDMIERYSTWSQTYSNMVEDVISRQAAIDALGDEPEVWTGKDEYAMGLNNQWHYDRNAIKAVPSAQPERKKGQWIRNDNGTYSCSVCQSWIPEEQHCYAQYCLYCGADMRERREE